MMLRDSSQWLRSAHRGSSHFRFWIFDFRLGRQSAGRFWSAVGRGPSRGAMPDARCGHRAYKIEVEGLAPRGFRSGCGFQPQIIGWKPMPLKQARWGQRAPPRSQSHFRLSELGLVLCELRDSNRPLRGRVLLRESGIKNPKSKIETGGTGCLQTVASPR